jgi:hypothetical protein
VAGDVPVAPDGLRIMRCGSRAQRAVLVQGVRFMQLQTLARHETLKPGKLECSSRHDAFSACGLQPDNTAQNTHTTYSLTVSACHSSETAHRLLRCELTTQHSGCAAKLSEAHSATTGLSSCRLSSAPHLPWCAAPHPAQRLLVLAPRNQPPTHKGPLLSCSRPLAAAGRSP